MPKWLAGRRVGLYCLLLIVALAVPAFSAAREQRAPGRGSRRRTGRAGEQDLQVVPTVADTGTTGPTRDRQVVPRWRAGRRVGLCCLLLTLALVVPGFTTARDYQASERGSGRWSGSWIVHMRPAVTDDDAARLLADVGATQLGELDEVGARVVDIAPRGQKAALATLRRDPRVVSVEADQTAQMTELPNDPRWGRQWGPRRVRAPEAWRMTTGRPGIVIAIVDTGVDARHPDLRGRVLRGWDFQNNDARANDDNGHGTAVAGVAAASGNDRVGIAGLCWKCSILPVKVLNANGSGSHSNIAAGVIWAAKRGADVINMSLATPTWTQVLSDAVAYARRKGAVVVAAAGNEGSRRRFYPAALPGVISVAASNGNDALYRWSNRGSWISVAAPGCAYTTRRGGSWSLWCGTSFATPAVAGTVALVKSLRPRLGRSALERSVLSTARRISPRFLAGRLDAARAIRAVSDK